MAGTGKAPEFRDGLLQALEATFHVFQQHLEDISEEEAQRSPTGNLSPIVWQVGHIATVDGGFAVVFGGARTPPDSYREIFGRGSRGGAGKYPALGDVRQACASSHQALVSAVRSADLGAPAELMGMTKSIGDWGMLGVFHRGYHTAKIATLRVLLGKPRLLG